MREVSPHFPTFSSIHASSSQCPENQRDMSRLRIFAILLLAALPASAQQVTITAEHLMNRGQPLTGTITFTAAGMSGRGFHVGSTGQFGGPVARDVANGAILTTLHGVEMGVLMLPDTSLSAPPNVCFSVTTGDANGGYVFGGPLSGYACVQPSANNDWCSAGVCNFDNYTPNIATLPLGPSLAELTVGLLNVTTLTCVGGCPGGTPSNATPLVDSGSGGPGSSNNYTREGHFHPTDTSRAADSAVPHLTGNETIAGVKTFSSSPIVPDPTNSTDAANKEYVLTNAGTVYPPSGIPNSTGGSYGSSYNSGNTIPCNFLPAAVATGCTSNPDSDIVLDPQAAPASPATACEDVLGNPALCIYQDSIYGLSTEDTSSNVVHYLPWRPPAGFSTLPSCSSSTEGLFYAVTDSATNTWGASCASGGSLHVECYCDGSSWTVEAK